MTEASLNNQELTALLAHELGRRAAFEQDWHDDLRAPFLRICAMLETTVASGSTLFICGNGGSAAQAQHLAAELVGRFRQERRGLPAVALSTDTSAVTAIGNDYGFEEIFRRQAEALMKEGDMLLGLSTSGNSPNVVNALRWAREAGFQTAALTGEKGGEMGKTAEICAAVPSGDTDLIQERHMVLLHVLAAVAERTFATGQR